MRIEDILTTAHSCFPEQLKNNKKGQRGQQSHRNTIDNKLKQTLASLLAIRFVSDNFRESCCSLFKSVMQNK